MLAARTESARGVRIAATVLATALTAAAAQVSVPLPFTSVPFTLQPMVVLLAGAALGARAGAVSQILYLLAGLAGLPVFAASPVLPQGAARLIGPTAGYLLSYPFAAWTAGALASRGRDHRYLTSFAAMIAGLAVIFACGVLWLAVWPPKPLGLAGALAAGFYPFLLADLAKLAIAAAVLPTAWRLIGDRRQV
jgi:biotin transport system substrate-specific component